MSTPWMSCRHLRRGRQAKTLVTQTWMRSAGPFILAAIVSSCGGGGHPRDRGDGHGDTGLDDLRDDGPADRCRNAMPACVADLLGACLPDGMCTTAVSSAGSATCYE